MRREIDEHSGAPPPDGRSEDRLADTDPLSADTDDPQSSRGLVVPGADSDRLTTKAFKFFGEEAAAGLIRAAAVGVIVLIWLAFGNPSAREVLHAIRPYWDEFGLAVAGFLAGVLVCLPRLLAGRRAIKRGEDNADQEQAALQREATSDDRRQREIYRSTLLEALPRHAREWLRNDPMQTTWLRRHTVELEKIAAGDSPLCSPWNQTGPEELRRALVDAVTELWTALGPPLPSPEHPSVMIAATTSRAGTEHCDAVHHAYQRLTNALDLA